MKQREVTDQDNLTWTCVQAYAAVTSKTAEEATALAETDSGEVTVVCTPTGGAQTVRLQLNNTWLEELTDDQLKQAIAENQK